MLVPISWLRDYVKIENLDLQDFCDKMIMSGSNIEETYKVGSNINGIVIGKAIHVEKHPDADQLFIVQVDVGAEILQIITGADNVTAGALVPVILHGGTLPDGKKIKKGKLRGLESNGMLCSFEELGYEDKVIPVADKDGIMILQGDFQVGADFATSLDSEQNVVDFEITPNRPDCLCMVGMAREVAAVYEQSLAMPVPVIKKEQGQVEDYIAVTIKRSDLCTRYVARIVKDIKIERSPWWLQNRLICAGMRPINNIVDITNYVMLELGTPIHAFDLRSVAQNKILVDVAKDGEKFTTLDGTERTLDRDCLLINDGEKGIALAGIMGGLNSEIRPDTNTILVEAACFEADSTRKTSKKLGLRTEASARFEKGVDANLCRIAADRVCQLIEELGAGTVTKGAVDIYPQTIVAPTTTVRTARVNHLLGIALSTAEIKSIFERLAMKVNVQGDTLKVTPPTVRIDLLEEIDYVEEVARIYGYNRFPATLPKGNEAGLKSTNREREDLAQETLIGLGLNEIQTYSFVSPKGVEKILCDENSPKRNFVRLLNPLGDENSVMRTTLIPNMLEVLERNYSRNLEQVQAFELGRIFLDDHEGLDGLPMEPKSLALGMYGPGQDFYTIKGICEALFQKLGITDSLFTVEKDNKTFHPGRCAMISKDQMTIGVIGEISGFVIEQYNLPERVYVCELDFEIMHKLSNREIYYQSIPKYPSIKRDIALVVKEQVAAGTVERLIKKHGGILLERVELFDVYRGKQVTEGYKSMAYELRYTDPLKTLTDEEISIPHEKILNALKKELGATLREV